jgi:hypothetical protein
MSVVCYVLGLSPVQIAALQEHPSLASDLAKIKQHEASDADMAAILSRMPSERRSAAEAQRRAFEETPMQKEADARRSAARARLDPIGPKRLIWRSRVTCASLPVHWRCRSPRNRLVMRCWPARSSQDVGCGPARLRNEKETQDFARFLETLDEAVPQVGVNYREMSRAACIRCQGGQGRTVSMRPSCGQKFRHTFPAFEITLLRSNEGC